MHYILWLVLSAACFGVGEVWSKKLSMDPRLGTGLITMAWYLIGSAAWLPAIIQKKELIVAGTIWSVLTLLATVGIGLWFGEEFTWRVGAGVTCALAAVVFLGSA